jgi:hypothetical protein
MDIGTRQIYTLVPTSRVWTLTQTVLYTHTEVHVRVLATQSLPMPKSVYLNLILNQRLQPGAYEINVCTHISCEAEVPVVNDGVTANSRDMVRR